MVYYNNKYIHYNIDIWILSPVRLVNNNNNTMKIKRDNNNEYNNNKLDN